MSTLSSEDRNRLVDILKNKDFARNNKDWITIFDRADMSKLLSQIDLDGSPLVKTSTVIRRLDDYGRISNEHHALGRLLNAIKELDYLNASDLPFIDRLLRDYKLMLPSIAVPYSGSRSYSDTFKQEKVDEVITQENTLKPVSFFMQALQVSRCVCFVATRKGSATGFLVGGVFVLTNNHVIGDRSELNDCIFRFNYQYDIMNLPEKTQDYRAKQDGLFHTKGKPLDYTLLELEAVPNEKLPGEKWGHVAMNPVKISDGDRVNIVQHPGGLDKHICVQHNFVEYVDDSRLDYLTSTMKGSSGSPVFDDYWRLVGLHHSGGNILEPGNKTTFYRNEGTLISAILKDLPSDVSSKININDLL